MTREEAIEKARQMSLPKETREILEALAPELRESEDERIRTFLLDYAIEMIAGLESDISRSTYDGIKGHDPDAEAELTQWQKARAYLEKQKEQKPVEWNDADMREARDNLITVCRDWERGELTTLLPIVATRARYFLEHLIEPQKPAEWSEEDEDRIRQIERIAQQAGCTQKLQEEIHDWLKSLRPSWKPSEEQMKALFYAIQVLAPRAAKASEELENLREQLKKLM